MRHKSRIIKYYRGLIGRMPLLGVLYFLVILGNIGMPMTVNFIGEILSYMGGIEVNMVVTLIGSLSMIVNGGYTVYLYNKKLLGELTLSGDDIDRKGCMRLIPMILIIYVMGVMP